MGWAPGHNEFLTCPDSHTHWQTHFKGTCRGSVKWNLKFLLGQHTPKSAALTRRYLMLGTHTCCLGIVWLLSRAASSVPIVGSSSPWCRLASLQRSKQRPGLAALCLS